MAEVRIIARHGGFPGVAQLAQRAAVRVLNRVATSARGAAARAVAADMGIKQKVAREAITVKKVNFTRPEAWVVASGKRLPLYDLGARPRKPGNRAVSYQGEGGRTTAPSAFIARMPSGHVGVFKRIGPRRPARRGRYRGQNRQKIIELFGPSVSLSFQNEKNLAILRGVIEARMPIEVKQAMNFAAGGS